MVLAQSIFYSMPLVLSSAFFDSATSHPPVTSPARPMVVLGHASSFGEICEGRINETIAQLHRLQRKYGIFKEIRLSSLAGSGPLVRISYNEVSVNYPDALGWHQQSSKRRSFQAVATPNSNYINIMAEVDPKKATVMRSNIGSAYSLASVIKTQSFIAKTIELLEIPPDELNSKAAPFELRKWILFPS